MKVVFARTAQRRYKVTIERPGAVSLTMDPAPGYHDRFPHDAAHFIVEDELKILGGVFGQLAAGGTANTYFAQDARSRRKARKRGAEIARSNKKDALFSEHAIYAAQSRWEKQDIIPDTKIPPTDIARIIERFESFAQEWSRLPVGGVIALEWRHFSKQKR